MPPCFCSAASSGAPAVRLVRQGALADRRPAPRFGGQQHRVALARAPAVIPRVFLLNERLFSRVR